MSLGIIAFLITISLFDSDGPTNFYHLVTLPTTIWIQSWPDRQVAKISNKPKNQFLLGLWMLVGVIIVGSFNGSLKGALLAKEFEPQMNKVEGSYRQIYLQKGNLLLYVFNHFFTDVYKAKLPVYYNQKSGLNVYIEKSPDPIFREQFQSSKRNNWFYPGSTSET